MYYQDADAAVIVYDLGDIETFEDAIKWVQELDKFMDKKIPMALAGNKADLPERVVPEEKIEEFIATNNAKSFNTSAKTGANIAEVFKYLAEEIVKIHKVTPAVKPTGIMLGKPKKKSKPCC